MSRVFCFSIIFAKWTFTVSVSHLSRKRWPDFAIFPITWCDFFVFTDATSFTQIDHAWFLEMEPSVWWAPSRLGPSNQLITNSLGRKERKDQVLCEAVKLWSPIIVVTEGTVSVKLKSIKTIEKSVKNMRIVL